MQAGVNFMLALDNSTVETIGSSWHTNKKPFLYSESTYRRIGLSGAHRFLAHTAYQAHTIFLTKSV